MQATLPTNSAGVVGAWRRHPLVRGRHFYTLPTELLEEVVDQVGEERFDRDLLGLDRALARQSGDHSMQVGFRDGTSIRYDLLGQPMSLSAALLEASAHLQHLLPWLAGAVRRPRNNAATEQRLQWAHNIARGYAGWLCTNPQFLQEQRVFFGRWKCAIQRFGVSGPASQLLDRGAEASFVTARDALLARWSLVDLAGPFLPAPPRPQLPAAPPAVTVGAAPLGVSVFYPTVFPLPEANMLRAMLEDAVGRQRLPEHLREWSDLTAGNNQGKKKIDRYARIFLVQHFWRVLFGRHGPSLRGSVGAVHLAFASYLIPHSDLRCGAETVRKDLALLAKAYGAADWFRRPSIYDSM